MTQKETEGGILSWMNKEKEKEDNITDEEFYALPDIEEVIAEQEEVEPEQQAFMDVLKSSFYGVEGRTKQDRHQEFNKVFMGSDEGRRVLYEILALAKLSARLVPPFPQPIDKDRMLVLMGARELAADILDVLAKEYNTNRPTKVNRRPKDAV